ncbi:MAG: hypothetical protein B6I26_00305 [Desulfobacteraceae bacterium 4572_130]|nr:MAG: hypothetical protein B6I26_00305 [Desulfobacteraceae bacterium 4572_130]
MKSDFTIKTGDDYFSLKADVKFIGNDLLIAIYGGEKPHIGAVSCAHPRPSLKKSDIISSTASVICLSAHKEYDIAKAVSEILASCLNTTTVVTAGMHWDKINDQEIKKVIKNSRILVDLILDILVKKSKS